MATRFAYYNPDRLEGLVLWASYPSSDNDLSGKDLHVVTVYGSQDGLATVEKVEASFRLLPVTAVKVLILGGNHAQFGWYGNQEGDNQASISREAQQEQAITACLDLLKQIESSKIS